MATAWLSTLRAQPAALAIVRRAVSSGRVHHAYLFEGADGVGKELAAFGFAQALVCERRAEGSADACGECRACARAVPQGGERAPRHPDVVVLERGLYEPATIGRRSPETQDLSIDQIRTLVLARAAFPPYEGRAKIFIVRRAEELSTAAANALLKTLEEPGAHTHFVLLSSAADSLLPTIRSRTLRVRFGVLPDELVATLLVERGSEQGRAAAVARLAGGSMATAIVLDDPEASAVRQRFVSRAMASLESRDAGAAFDLAEESKKVPRDALVVQLHALAASLGDEGRGAVGSATDGRALRASARYSLAMEAVVQVESNASAQLAVEAMLLRMRDA
jgi:DNA polymerase-3 subunit delta'